MWTANLLTDEMPEIIAPGDPVCVRAAQRTGHAGLGNCAAGRARAHTHRQDRPGERAPQVPRRADAIQQAARWLVEAQHPDVRRRTRGDRGRRERRSARPRGKAVGPSHGHRRRSLREFPDGSPAVHGADARAAVSAADRPRDRVRRELQAPRARSRARRRCTSVTIPTSSDASIRWSWPSRPMSGWPFATCPTRSTVFSRGIASRGFVRAGSRRSRRSPRS